MIWAIDRLHHPAVFHSLYQALDLAIQNRADGNWLASAAKRNNRLAQIALILRQAMLDFQLPAYRIRIKDWAEKFGVWPLLACKTPAVMECWTFPGTYSIYRSRVWPLLRAKTAESSLEPDTEVLFSKDKAPVDPIGWIVRSPLAIFAELGLQAYLSDFRSHGGLWARKAYEIEDSRLFRRAGINVVRESSWLAFESGIHEYVEPMESTPLHRLPHYMQAKPTSRPFWLIAHHQLSKAFLVLDDGRIHLSPQGVISLAKNLARLQSYLAAFRPRLEHPGGQMPDKKLVLEGQKAVVNGLNELAGAKDCNPEMTARLLWRFIDLCNLGPVSSLAIERANPLKARVRKLIISLIGLIGEDLEEAP